MLSFHRFARHALLSATIAFRLISPGLEAADPQIVLEVGRDYPETRLFSVCPVTIKRTVAPSLAVAGFSRSGQADIADLSVFELTEKGNPVLRWRLLRGGTESSSIRTLRAADLDGDGEDELIALGRIGNEEVNSRGELQIFRHFEEQWNSVALQRWQSGQYTHGYGMDIADLDSDGKPELVTGGFFLKGENEQAELRVWKLDDTRLVLVASTSWGSQSGHTRINAVRIGDVTGDGKIAIVSVGRTGQIKQDEHLTTNEADQLSVWYFDKNRLVRYSAFENEPASRSRFRELRLVDLDGLPGLEFLAVGRQEPSNVIARKPGSGGGKGDGSGGGRNATGGGTEWSPQIRPLMSIFKLDKNTVKRVGEAKFGDSFGEVRDIAAARDTAGKMRVVTMTANEVKPNRSARLEIWELKDSSLQAIGQRTIAVGDETRARQIILWGPDNNRRILTIGFVQRGEQILGQMLDWGPL